ncbi:MAG: ABC transporter permease [Deltaproteobacteria bacterium]|nr:ABC transporter permease [Deltaproteobacteria bacterium]
MNIIRTLAVAKKETRQIIRDSRSLYLALGIPVMLMILFGFALSLDVDNIPIAVWDQAKSPESREFVDAMTSSGYFRCVIQTDNYREIVRNLDNNIISMGITIPFDFSRNIRKGTSTLVQAIVDGSDSTRANLAIVYLETIVTTFENDIKMESMTRQSVQGRISPPVEPKIRIVYNPELKSRNNIIPGLIPVIMMIIAALLTSLTIVRERETGTMEQLMSTPLKSNELIVGKLIPYFVLGYVDLLMVYLMGRFVFQVPFRGSLLIMFMVASVFLVGALSIGFLVSVVASNQFFATQLALLGTVLPTFLLSGFVFPIANMPVALQYFTYIIPARHFITILRAIYLKGVGWEAILGSTLALVIFAFFVTALAARKLGKNVL